jgi:PAS domain-containing protein
MPEGDWIALVELYGVYAAAFTVGVGLITFIYKKGIKPLYNHIKTCYSIADKIDHIFQEFRPNGGISIKDKIDKIDTNLIYMGERQRALLADVEFAHCEMDTEGRCIWINRTYTRLVERIPSEILGNGWHNCIAANEREFVLKSWFDSVKDDRELSINFNFETPSGELRPVRGTSYKMTNPEGETIGFMGKLTIL